MMRYSTRIVLGLLMIALVALAAACQPAASSITVTDAWARAAASGADEDMGMDVSDDASGDGEMAADDESGSGGEMAMGGMADSRVSAAYMVITNSGGADDRLVSAATAAAGVVEIHETTIENDIARMTPLADGLPIPANSSVTLQPSGLHIMLMDLQENLVDGETLTLTLTFESGTEVTVEAEIRAP